MPQVGILGGSGLYQMDGLTNLREVHVNTPFGLPSDAYVIGELAGVEVAFLPRHGRGHRLLPSEVNYRANIYGFKSLGVSRLISVAACGSLKETIRPLDIVAVDQFFDRTNSARAMTFFGDGVAAHVSLADPVCPDLHDRLVACANQTGARVHPTGTYLNMEGPAFSTRAESQIYRAWGLDVIGMTNFAEAKLAREAEICYATVAMVTDFDVWHEEEEDVSIATVIDNLHKNAAKAQEILRLAVKDLTEERTCECGRALECAIITEPSKIPPAAKQRLQLLIGHRI